MRSLILIVAALAILSGVAGAQAVAPYVQSFESFAAPQTLVPGIGSTPLGSEWDVGSIGANPGAVVIENNTTYAPPVQTNYISMASAANASEAITELVLHIDGLASDTGSGYAVRFLIRENSDEVDVNDVIALTDGLTPGDRITQTGAPMVGTPGYGGHQEVLLLDWNTFLSTAGGNPTATSWREATITIDSTFLAANGLTNTSDMRLIFRQDDNSTLTGGDGFLIDEVSVVDANFTDITVISVDAPTTPQNCATLTNNEIVTATLQNTGLNTLTAGTMVPIIFDRDSGAQVVVESYGLTGTLAPGATEQFSFVAGADLSATGAHTLDVSVALGADQNPLNDNLQVMVMSGGTAAFPYVENFDTHTTTNNDLTPPPGWFQEQTDNGGVVNGDWFFRNTPTTTANTGPATDHTTGMSGVGFYAHVEDTGNLAAVSLLSPCFNVSAVASPTLRFFVHSNNSQGPAGAAENFLALDIVDPVGETLDVITPIGHLGDFWQEVLVDLTAYQGSDFRVRFRGRSDGGSTTHDIAIDDVEVFDNVTPDVFVASIDAPAANLELGCGVLSATEPVTITVGNAGVTLNTSDVIPVTFTVDDGINPPATVFDAIVLAAPLPTGGTVQHTFTTGGANLSVVGLYTFSADTQLTGDSDPSNDMVTGHMVQVGGATVVNVFPFSENFDTFTTVNDGIVPPVDWVQDQNDAFGAQNDWRFRNTATTSTGTGPSADNTTGVSGTGYYAYVEDSGGHHPMVNLLTPCLDTTGLANPFLTFFVHSNLADIPGTDNLLHVDVVDEVGSTVHSDIITPIGHVGDFWFQVGVLLNPYESTGYRIRFRMDTTNGGTNDFTHDIAIDDVVIGEAPPLGTGQAGCPGVAELFVNDAVEVNGFGVASGFPGPFSTSVVGGTETVDITVAGEANRAIILVAGPINANALNLGAAGQLDVGVPNPVPPFLPTGLVLVWNGFDVTFPNLIYRTNSAGMFTSSFLAPEIPGFVIGLQAILQTGLPSVVKTSNAVELTIN